VARRSDPRVRRRGLVIGMVVAAAGGVLAALLWLAASTTVGICIGTAPATVQATVPTTSFTLAWMHSVEKIRWEEDYRLEAGRLVMTAARVRGSGAGMEPPEGAVLRDGAWEYQPAQTEFPTLRLTRSPYTRDYEMCWDAQCREFTALVGKPGAGETIEVFPCPFP
jgi:hypothetical protein